MLDIILRIELAKLIADQNDISVAATINYNDRSKHHIIERSIVGGEEKIEFNTVVYWR